MVEPISGPSEIPEFKKLKPIKPKKARREGKDTLSISSKAKYSFELEKYKKIALEARDIRWDKVKAAQQRIKEGFYNKPKIVEEITSKMLEENDLLKGGLFGIE
jgi:hypothetical protein